MHEPLILLMWSPLGVSLVCLVYILMVKLVTRLEDIWYSSEWQKLLAYSKSIGALTDKSIAIAGGLAMPLRVSSCGTCSLLLQVWTYLWGAWKPLWTATCRVDALWTILNWMCIAACDCRRLKVAIEMICTLLLPTSWKCFCCLFWIFLKRHDLNTMQRFVF